MGGVGGQYSNLQLALGVALVVTINTALSHWLARRGFGWAFTLGQFMVMAMVNLGLILVYAFLRSRFDDPVSVSIGNALFFALLLTLLVALFDHYRQVYLMRFGPKRLAEELRRAWPADLSTQDVIDSIRR